MNKQEALARRILNILDKEYPDHKTLLRYSSPFELLIAVILSAQTTDEQVNRVLPALFSRYPGAEELAAAEPGKVETLVHATGFYKNKAKHIIACSRKLISHFYGKVPDTMEELTSLPGVGRKTAGVVLYHIFNVPAIIVDTHFGRVCRRIGLTEEQNPTKLEWILRALFPESKWGTASMVINLHGRKVCISRKPECDHCVISALCANRGKSRNIK